MTDIPQLPSSGTPSHPEEINSVFEMSMGPYFTMRASARITPAGVISAGITTAAILVAVGYLISSTKGRKG